jgi:D-xylose transport system ATP-binding protein
VTASATAPVLAMHGINKSFGAVHVLQDVDFDAYAGQVTALVGDNGAGKSTLIKCAGGIHPIDSGVCYFEGHPVAIHNPKQAAQLGIEIVYQDLALCDNLDIVQNMFLGREYRTLGMLNEPAMEKLALSTLSGLSVRTVASVRQRVGSLSGGQRQTVAIAKAVLWNSKLVILDEPTAALGVAQTRQVLDLVRRLADNGLAVVLISHNMNDVFEVADRIAALYLGRMAAVVNASEVTHGQVVELITTGRMGGPNGGRGSGTGAPADSVEPTPAGSPGTGKSLGKTLGKSLGSGAIASDGLTDGDAHTDTHVDTGTGSHTDTDAGTSGEGSD